MRYNIRYGNFTDKQVREYLKTKIEDGAVRFEYTDTMSYIRVLSPKGLLVAERRYLEKNGFEYDMGKWYRERTLHPDNEKLASLKLLKNEFKYNFFTKTIIESHIDAEENISIDQVLKDLKGLISEIQEDINLLETYSG
jgi:hypothetical protein